MLRIEQRKRGVRRGSIAVEFALVSPILLFMLVGMVVYGGWFWLAHSVQSLAYESARASLGGLDAVERRQLALDFVVSRGPQIGVPVSASNVQVSSDNQVVSVKINYDVTNHPIMVLRSLTVPPPQNINREAVVRLGGY
ncbi:MULTISPECIES: TadE/TadG family type IV pilus assembly protein [unclassified Brevundimonas]|uniref:TadE/TadG family type IV pilus assembly protein n=1 Tax=unclassified Brevundimonas TaxID=2622653 RepID=UPI0025C0684B|nr:MULTISPECIES: TadE/TadG family type IV pilus assembly protein [unclassified Brevundimonas]